MEPFTLIFSPFPTHIILVLNCRESSVILSRRFMQPIQTLWGISEAPEGKQFKSYQNARNKCSEVAIQNTGASKEKQGGHGTDGVEEEEGGEGALQQQWRTFSP